VLLRIEGLQGTVSAAKDRSVRGVCSAVASVRAGLARLAESWPVFIALLQVTGTRLPRQIQAR
jgi:hypothetical protein